MTPRAVVSSVGAWTPARRGVAAFAAVAGVALLGGCAASPDDDVAAYVDRAIAEMHDGIHADTAAFRDAVAAAEGELKSRSTIAETYPGLGELVAVAGGEHSWLWTPAEAAEVDKLNAPDAGFAVPTASTVDGVTLVALPAFNGQEPEAVERYRTAGLDAIRDAASFTACGWIIDLRTNGGGNAWAMLGVVAPLLDDGDVVGLKRDDTIRWARVEDGGVVSTPGGPDTTSPASFSLDAPVAILTSGMTASAAEIVAIAFAGQDDVVRVGTATAGMTTGNDPRELSDGALLVLTTTYDVDRSGRVYDGPMEPDIEVVPGPDLTTARSELHSRCA